MTYQYYVTFKYTRGDDYGDSAVAITRDNKIDSGDEITEVTNFIASKHDYDGVLIQNFILLKEAK